MSISSEMTPAMYAEAVGAGMTEPEAAKALLAARYEAIYRRALESSRICTRLRLELALIAYVNGQPLPKMGRRVMDKFKMSVKPYGDLLKWNKNASGI